MASDLSAEPQVVSTDVPGRSKIRELNPLWHVLKFISSLKVTVVLLAMATFLVLAGTLAQTQIDVWEVVKTYFRTPFAWIPVSIFAFFWPDLSTVPSYIAFPFPGGFTIGILMFINLLAAHGLRFKAQAVGGRLLAGIAVILAGATLIWLIVAGNTGHATLGTYDVDWAPIWFGFKCVLGLAGLVLCGAVARAISKKPVNKILVGVLLGTATAVSSLALYYWIGGKDADLPAPSMRILWQLTSAGFASCVLLAGCYMVFKKRAGIVLIHAGVGLMMANELVVTYLHEEGQMTLREGEDKDYALDIRKFELAVVAADDPNRTKDETTVVPRDVLQAAEASKELIHHADLPFDIRVQQILPNSKLREVTKDKNAYTVLEGGNQKEIPNPATNGAGRNYVVDQVSSGTGTDMKKLPDVAATYVQLLKKGAAEPLGTYLVSPDLRPQTVEVDGKKYEIALRFKQLNKPYNVHLNRVTKKDYKGIDKPQDFRSIIRLTDEKNGVDRNDLAIWMNNPLRYGGDTLYQSGYAVDEETMLPVATLAVVANTAWMLPYVGCMMVLVGMLGQFLQTLARFIQRATTQAKSLFTEEIANLKTVRDDGISPEVRAGHRPISRSSNRNGKNSGKGNGRSIPVAEVVQEAEPLVSGFWSRWVFPLAVLALFVGWFAYAVTPPNAKFNEMDLLAMGRLPLHAHGRIMPFDTLARVSMRVMCQDETCLEPYEDNNGKERERAVPAMRWLMEVIAKPEKSEKYRIFRIDNREIQRIFKLEPRPSLRYSVAELRPEISEFNRLVHDAQKKPSKQWDVFDRKLIELDTRIKTATIISAAFTSVDIPELPTHAEFEANREEGMKKIAKLRDFFQQLPKVKARLDKMEPALAVPDFDKQDWESYAIAIPQQYLNLIVKRDDPGNPAVKALVDIFEAYARDDAPKFNSLVADYQQLLDQRLTPGASLSKVRVEEFFNYARPYYNLLVLYFVAGFLASVGIVMLVFSPTWRVPLNRASFLLILTAFACHTAALIFRIYITERAPATNLYSVAIFGGWGCVVFGMILEGIYRLGFGNSLAAVAGWASLVIANVLSNEGDMMPPLQAVLDTQFWLATHVVCVTLGYATTFVAGLLGIYYFAWRALSAIRLSQLETLPGQHTDRDDLEHLTDSVSRILGTSIYGLLCFAILFSFFGTVLGGLWADDSWGRFWGWDPKENGAMMIVLWNSLALHARWDGLVKHRGLALLAIFGNVVVAWSMFGVNELGVGLHSYGATEGVKPTMLLFMASQLLLIVGGSFLSSKSSQAAPPADLATS